MIFTLNSQKVLKIDVDKIIDFFIDYIEWYEYSENGSMHQCYDFDKDAIKNTMSLLFKDRISDYDRVELIIRGVSSED